MKMKEKIEYPWSPLGTVLSLTISFWNEMTQEISKGNVLESGRQKEPFHKQKVQKNFNFSSLKQEEQSEIAASFCKSCQA